MNDPSNHSRTLWQRMAWVLRLQLAWAALCVAWNLGGVVLVANGLRSPGPTASIMAAAIIAALALALVIASRRWPICYALISTLMGLMALAAVVNAFVADPALWPSEFWRYAGALLNGVGLLAAVLAVIGFTRWKSSFRSDSIVGS